MASLPLSPDLFHLLATSAKCGYGKHSGAAAYGHYKTFQPSVSGRAENKWVVRQGHSVAPKVVNCAEEVDRFAGCFTMYCYRKGNGVFREYTGYYVTGDIDGDTEDHENPALCLLPRSDMQDHRDVVDGLPIAQAMPVSLAKKSDLIHLRDILVSDSATSVGEHGFAGWPARGLFEGLPLLTRVDFADRRVEQTPFVIGTNLFNGNPRLKKIRLCLNAKNEDARARQMILLGTTFNNCPGLTHVALPDTLKTLAVYGTFNGCESLKTIKLPKSLVLLEGTLRDSGIANIALPNSLRWIGPGVFKGCNELQSVIWQYPNKPCCLEDINDEAFSGCISLEKIAVPNSVKTIGKSAFEKCIVMDRVLWRNVHEPCELKSIGSRAFRGCISLTEFQTGLVNAAEIGKMAFENCATLRAFVMRGTGMEAINDAAFRGCWQLRRLECPSPARISETAFEGSNITAAAIA